MIVILSCLRGLNVLHLVVILRNEVVTIMFVIYKIFLESLIQEGLTGREISPIADVSERTIYRYMTEYDLKTRYFSKVSDNQLALEVLALAKSFLWGNRARRIKGQYSSCKWLWCSARKKLLSMLIARIFNISFIANLSYWLSCLADVRYTFLQTWYNSNMCFFNIMIYKYTFNTHNSWLIIIRLEHTKNRSIQNGLCLVELRILYSNLWIHVW